MPADSAANKLVTDEEGYLVDPAEWDDEVAQRFARDEGLTLTEEHRRVVGFIRDYYEEHKIAPGVRLVIKFLETEMGRGRSAHNDLFRMFPYGYVRQACRIAGMRKPRAWSTG